MTNIHFPVISPESYKVIISNVAKARGVIKKLEIDCHVTYNIFMMHYLDSFTNDFEVGKTVGELQNLNHIVQMINNYKYNKPLLEGITISKGFRKLVKEIDSKYDKKLDYTCVVLSVFRPYVLVNMYIGFLIKRNNPNIDIMIGGIHLELSEHTVNILRYIKVFEYVTNGDFDITLENYLLGKLTPFKEYKLVSDINDYIMPLYTLVELAIFKFMVIRTARGCPNICSFCPGSHGKFNVMNLDHAIDTFKYYNSIFKKITSEKNKFEILINDNTLNYSRHRIIDLSKRLISIKNNIKISESYHVFRNLDEEIIDDMKLARFTNVFVGIDSFHEDKLKLVMHANNKKEKDFIHLIKKFYENNINLTVSIVYNCPGESREAFNCDLDLMKSLRKQFPDESKFELRLYSYNHNPGAIMYKQPELYGITYEYWNEMDCYDPNLNKFIVQVPKYYFSSISRDEYIYRYKLASDFNRINKYILFDRSINNESIIDWCLNE